MCPSENSASVRAGAECPLSEVLSRKFRSPENFGPRTIFSKRNWSGRTDFFKKIGPPKKILVCPQVQQKSSM